MDFRSPSETQIADFLLHLFQDRKLQPSTIEGYRPAIADMVGNDKFNISKDENLTCLLDSFHRDKPKGRRGVPTWNLSLVLHQLTMPPFEPMRKASLKHLTFKTVFLLALGSGKRCSEIHAWLYKNIRTTGARSLFTLHPVSYPKISWLRGESFLCGPSGYTSSSTNPRQVSPGGQNNVSGESFELLSRQDQGFVQG